MQLALTVCLTWALLHSAESLRCHQCIDRQCSNTTSVTCPATSTTCRTVSAVTQSVTVITAIGKSCSTTRSCATPPNVETEVSVNRGFRREALTQLCCTTDNCNFQTLASPNLLANGKQCPSCRSEADSVAGNCNAMLTCAGVENSCIYGTIPSGFTQTVLKGCMSRNLCTNLEARHALLGNDVQVTCKAPWSLSISVALLTFGLTACKVLV